MNVYACHLIKWFKQNRDEKHAGPMKKYMKDQFEFLGLKKPQRTECMRWFIRENDWPKESEWKVVVETLWEQPEREFQYAALEMIEKRISRREALKYIQG